MVYKSMDIYNFIRFVIGRVRVELVGKKTYIWLTAEFRIDYIKITCSFKNKSVDLGKFNKANNGQKLNIHH